MTQSEQAQRFYDELRAVVTRYEREYDLTVSQAIGIIEVLKLDIYTQQSEDAEEIDSE